MRVVVQADGGARGNPGPAGYGAVVRDAETGVVLAERWEALGVTTNNVAEYSGLIAGLEAALEMGATEVEVQMDSKLAIEQMSGRWQIKNPGLRTLAAKAAALQRKFRAVDYRWIPRERNKHADELANRAMDGADAVAETPAPAPTWEPRTDARTRLVLVRHGQTALTAEKRYSGRGDVPLTDTGRAQARAVAARVAAMRPEVAVTSPLSRCVETARLIGSPVVVEQDLIECDFGEWEGMTFADVRARFQSELDTWLGSTAVAPPGGESFQQVSKRVRAVVGRLRESYAGQTIAVVSHVSPIKLILRDALAAGDAILHRLYLDPTGLSIVDLYPDGGVAVRTVNDTSHLDGLGSP
ncbi:histidine phosphatase family protein [Allorhizocola rhizosphaerae]|uniref:histidine phosphatase family protein n=1 Tax=Allorhizocola rhizosphaerae TaxID=1872709 RepID=UPI001FEB8AFD|nr:histidine phosphatase family protein [Allorhizocola rhizosphaerae]